MEETPVFGFIYIRAHGGEIPSVQDMVLVAIGVKFIPLLSVRQTYFGAQGVDDG